MIDTRAAGEYLGLSPRTLDTYRWAGIGPDYYKMGRRVCYRRSRLDKWADERRRRSTSDDGGGDGDRLRRAGYPGSPGPHFGGPAGRSRQTRQPSPGRAPLQGKWPRAPLLGRTPRWR